MIKLTEETVTLRTDTPKNIGTKIDLQVELPERILLKHFTLNGTITGSEYVSNNGSGSYILEMKIGDLSPMNKKILHAYVDFLERENMLKETRVDLKALQEVFDDFGQKLRQLRATSELVKSNVEGILELLIRNREKKTTIH